MGSPGVLRDGLTHHPETVLRYFPCRSPGSFPPAHPPPGGRCTNYRSLGEVAVGAPPRPTIPRTGWWAARPGRAIGSSSPSQGGDCGFKSRPGYVHPEGPVLHGFRRQAFQACKVGSSPTGATVTRHGVQGDPGTNRFQACHETPCDQWRPAWALMRPCETQYARPGFKARQRGVSPCWRGNGVKSSGRHAMRSGLTLTVSGGRLQSGWLPVQLRQGARGHRTG
jgi:hypothetical protein